MLRSCCGESELPVVTAAQAEGGGGWGGGAWGGGDVGGELCLEAETVDKAAAGLVQPGEPGDLIAFLRCWPVQSCCYHWRYIC